MIHTSLPDCSIPCCDTEPHLCPIQASPISCRHRKSISSHRTLPTSQTTRRRGISLPHVSSAAPSDTYSPAFATGIFTPTSSTFDLLRTTFPALVSQTVRTKKQRRPDLRVLRMDTDCSSNASDTTALSSPAVATPVTPGSPTGSFISPHDQPMLDVFDVSINNNSYHTTGSASESPLYRQPYLTVPRADKRKSCQSTIVPKLEHEQDSQSILHAIERHSKLNGHSICVTCQKKGINYPRCRKCNDTWCSRECRLPGGLKRHQCSPKV